MYDSQKVTVWFIASKWMDNVTWRISTTEPLNPIDAMETVFGPYMLSAEPPQEVLDEMKRREDGPPVLPADVGIPEVA